MNIPVGTDKITDAAKQAIAVAGGNIEPALKPGVSIAVLPEGAEMLSSNAEGCFIALVDGITLRFTRAWNTEDCSLDLCR